MVSPAGFQLELLCSMLHIAGGQDGAYPTTSQVGQRQATKSKSKMAAVEIISSSRSTQPALPSSRAWRSHCSKGVWRRRLGVGVVESWRVKAWWCWPKLFPESINQRTEFSEGPSASKHPYTPKTSITGTGSSGIKELVCNSLGPYNCTFTTIKAKKKNSTKHNPARLTTIHFQRPPLLLMRLICRENCLKWGNMPVFIPPGPPVPQHLWTEWGQARRMQTGWTRRLQVWVLAAAFILRIYLRKTLLEGTLAGHRRHH